MLVNDGGATLEKDLGVRALPLAECYFLLSPSSWYRVTQYAAGSTQQPLCPTSFFFLVRAAESEQLLGSFGEIAYRAALSETSSSEIATCQGDCFPTEASKLYQQQLALCLGRSVVRQQGQSSRQGALVVRQVASKPNQQLMLVILTGPKKR